MKKTLSIILVLLFVLAVSIPLASCGMSINEPEVFESSPDLELEINSTGDGYKLVGIGDCPAKDLIIGTYNTIPITEISADAFMNCDSIESVTIGSMVKKIDARAFNSCKNLKSVTIGNGVTSIANYAFGGCKNLKSVKLGNNVRSISQSAFVGCTSLEYNKYDNAYYLGTDSNPYYALIKPTGTRLEIRSCIINESTRIFANQAFYDYSIESIEIPDSVISISQACFGQCSFLSNLKIGNGVETIESGAFGNCWSLNNVVIGSNLRTIESGAFNACSKLKTVYYNGTSQQWKKVSILTSNSSLLSNDAIKNATKYYYSASMPSGSGRYWHYDSAGKPVAW